MRTKPGSAVLGHRRDLLRGPHDAAEAQPRQQLVARRVRERERLVQARAGQRRVVGLQRVDRVEAQLRAAGAVDADAVRPRHPRPLRGVVGHEADRVAVGLGAGDAVAAGDAQEGHARRGARPADRSPCPGGYLPSAMKRASLSLAAALVACALAAPVASAADPVMHFDGQMKVENVCFTATAPGAAGPEPALRPALHRRGRHRQHAGDRARARHRLLDRQLGPGADLVGRARLRGDGLRRHRLRPPGLQALDVRRQRHHADHQRPAQRAAPDDRLDEDRRLLHDRRGRLQRREDQEHAEELDRRSSSATAPAAGSSRATPASTTTSRR